VTKSNEPYSELLKHPKWQRKRLDILERENFTCQECGAKDKTLHVHHGYYRRGKMPWEYPDESLSCLCDDCHSRRHQWKHYLDKCVAELPTSRLMRVTGYAVANVGATDGLPIPLGPTDHAQGIADFYATEAEHVIALAFDLRNGQRFVDPCDLAAISPRFKPTDTTEGVASV
jgi:hypothetical protein